MKVDKDKLVKLCRLMLFDMRANNDRDNAIFGLILRPYLGQLGGILEDKHGEEYEI